jgi:hypothetical protein
LNVLEGLKEIRRRLDEQGSEPASLALVDQIAQRAALPAAQSAAATSLLQLVRMLMRHPIAAANTRVYNDLVRLEDELQTGAAVVRARIEAEEAKPIPKTKKFYKEQKEREKKTGS